MVRLLTVAPGDAAQYWEVIVVGAGPAGLLAATRAAERGRRTLLLEKGRRPGAKILISGGTRCNLTHAADRRAIVEAFGSQGRFLHSALAALGPDDLIALVEREGVRTKVEPGGKVFPVTDRAVDVQAALVQRLRRSGCELALEEPLQELAREDQGFRLVTSRRTLWAARVVLTTGGRSYPGCGTTGDGYRLAAGLGHAIEPPRPALVPVRTDSAWVRQLQGITVADVSVHVVAQGASGQDGSIADRPLELGGCRGSFLFTHFGLSGPAVLNVSRTITSHPRPQSLTLVCDFLPDFGEQEWREEFARRCAAAGKRQLGTLLDAWLPRRLIESILETGGLSGEQRAAEFPRKSQAKLVGILKRAAVPVLGTLGFEKAEVTAGGVLLREVDSRSMESKVAPGLYLAGELLDLDGPIGGYNFQAAFSTGWLAGEHV